MLFIESWNQNGIKVIHGLFVETTESTENKSAHFLRMTKDVIISDMNLSKFQSCMSIVCTWGTRIKLNNQCQSLGVNELSIRTVNC